MTSNSLLLPKGPHGPIPLPWVPLDEELVDLRRLIAALVACILPWDAAPGVDGEAMDVCRHRVLERQTDELDIVMPP